MARKRLLWRLFPSYLLVTAVSLAAITWFASRLWRDFDYEQTYSSLESLSHGLEGRFAEALARGQDVEALCKELGAKTRARITAILPSGKVVGDSQESPALMDNHAGRPEIQEAMAGRVGRAERFSPTLRRNMLYVAIPLTSDGALHGVLRAAVLQSSIDQALRANLAELALGGLIVALAAAAASWWIARRISRPMEEMRRGAERFAAGDLSLKLPVSDSQEIGALAEAMNQMAAQLDDRIRAIERQRNEQAAVLSSMVEGVLALDADQRVIWMNQALGRLIRVDPQSARGKSLPEVARNLDLQRLVERTLSTHEPVEGDLTLKEDGEVFVQAHAAPLRHASGQSAGALVVLNDVTRLRRLEQIRSDFVANVSHELRTPVTSIKGFVETLLDGAVYDPAEAGRFLRIVARQVDRLDSIIDDLLSLSWIEREGAPSEMALEEKPLEEAVREAIELCEAKAEAKSIRIEVKGEPGIPARINPPLFEQAVMNLLDNAIKHSETGSPVEIEVSRRECGEAVVAVRDQGCGIPKEHLPRLFERFYRVDKARSRKLGGTGLGLSIVKHIVQAHGGRVEVDSEVGRGSVFSIVLPGV